MMPLLVDAEVKPFREAIFLNIVFCTEGLRQRNLSTSALLEIGATFYMNDSVIDMVGILVH